MTIITHDDGAGPRIHIAYEGPYPWADGHREKAIAGVEGWAIFEAPRAEYLEGDLASDWDFTTGTFLGKRVVPAPDSADAIRAEMSALQTVMSSSDWYAARQAKTGIPIPEEVLAEYKAALEKYNDLELKLASLEVSDELDVDIR